MVIRGPDHVALQRLHGGQRYMKLLVVGSFNAARWINHFVGVQIENVCVGLLFDGCRRVLLLRLLVLEVGHVIFVA